MRSESVEQLLKAKFKNHRSLHGTYPSYVDSLHDIRTEDNACQIDDLLDKYWSWKEEREAFVERLFKNKDNDNE